MKYQFYAFIFMLFFASNCQGQETYDRQLQKMTTEQWREDFRSLYDSLRIHHLNLFHFTPKAEFDRKYQSIFNEIPKLQHNEIILRFKQFTALAGDGHTMLPSPAQYRKYPLEFFIFNKKLLLIKSEEKYKEALGLALISINDHPVKQILDSLRTITSQDESTLYTINEQAIQLSTVEDLMGFGFVSNPDSTTFEFLKGNNKIKIKIPAQQTDKPLNWKSAYKKTPLFLSFKDKEGVSIHHLALNSGAYYINFAGYPSWSDFEKITDSILIGLNQQKNLRKIIIDMRLNGGGNFYKGLKLMLPLFLDFSATHPTVKFYVIIGRQTFSAGMSNAVHFRDCLNATVVGEATGAKPNGYQEIKWFKLPNSKLSASCSQLLYTFQKKNTDGVQPDKKFAPRFEDYNQGNDVALNWILRHPQLK